MSFLNVKKKFWHLQSSTMENQRFQILAEDTNFQHDIFTHKSLKDDEMGHANDYLKMNLMNILLSFATGQESINYLEVIDELLQCHFSLNFKSVPQGELCIIVLVEHTPKK